MTMETSPTRQPMFLGLMVLVVLSGLSTIFAAVTTGAQAWQEHAQQRWPEVTARVDTCALKQTSTYQRTGRYIACRLSYAVGAEQNVAMIYSRNVASSIDEPFVEWVNEHPAGTPMIVRYDPTNHSKALLVADYMPDGGPRTPKNLKLLEVVAVIFLVLLTLAGITRPRSSSRADSVQGR